MMGPGKEQALPRGGKWRMLFGAVIKTNRNLIETSEHEMEHVRSSTVPISTVGSKCELRRENRTPAPE